ncbi:hypothetical protein AVEN_219866-1, partial [Araneus ventricosus]
LAEQVSYTTEKFSNPNNSEEENTINLTEKLKLSKFIEALRSDIRVEVKKLGPKTFKSAVAIAKNIDNALSENGGELNVTDSGINQILCQQLNTNKQILELSEKVNAISSQNFCVNSLTEAPATTSNNVQSNNKLSVKSVGSLTTQQGIVFIIPVVIIIGVIVGQATTELFVQIIFIHIALEQIKGVILVEVSE